MRHLRPIVGVNFLQVHQVLAVDRFSDGLADFVKFLGRSVTLGGSGGLALAIAVNECDLRFLCLSLWQAVEVDIPGWDFEQRPQESLFSVALSCLMRLRSGDLNKQ